ncbi:Succinate-semialdehyde dehydrogenase [Streptomyces sp. MBT84]|nr:aldehyde dehydrogenase family protein [Streptomyces sp. MBT84]MBW8699112.1 Succinate-semialdehyde dehydrogenase [Streptomyces sp. MBT84]
MSERERAEELATLIVLENGKTLFDARGEVTYAAEFFCWYAEEAVRVGGTVQTAPSGTNRILRKPSRGDRARQRQLAARSQTRDGPARGGPS